MTVTRMVLAAVLASGLVAGCATRGRVAVDPEVARDAEKPGLKSKCAFVLVPSFEDPDPRLLKNVLRRSPIAGEQQQVSQQAPAMFLDQSGDQGCVAAVKPSRDLLFGRFH